MSRFLSTQDPLVRMQSDLKRALAGDPAGVKWGMVIDLAKCIGCHACTVACVAENNLPPGVVYRPVLEEELGRFPSVSRRFIPRPCMHCQNPPCVKVCPVKATYMNQTGVIVVNYKRCLGCRYCLVACPYSARTSDFGDWYTADTPDISGMILGRRTAAAGYELKPAAEYGQGWPQRGKGSPIGNARKCHFCLHRLAVGLLPACVTTCTGRATIFGNRLDPEGLLFETISSPRSFRLKEELGTKPSVYYLA